MIVPETHCTGEDIDDLHQLNLFGTNGLDSTHYLVVKVIRVVSTNVTQLSSIFAGVGVLDINVNVVMRSGPKDNLEHVEVHFVIPLIVRLIEVLMPELGLILYDKRPEAKIIMSKK